VCDCELWSPVDDIDTSQAPVDLTQENEQMPSEPSSNPCQLPPLPSIDGNSFANIGRLIAFIDGQVDGYKSAADQMHAYARDYAAAQVAQERERCARRVIEWDGDNPRSRGIAAAIKKEER
jgi:hypothetical protein